MIIAHTADIHIRGLVRHEEYKLVFESLIKDVVSQRADALVIVGDIFHSKISGLTPEYISIFSEFVRNCAASVPMTYVVLGNHDGNLSNQSRLDSVSPIVEAIAAKNVICCKRSGIYLLPNGAELHVMSLFDKSTWDAVKPTAGKLCVAAYHGSVSGAETDLGWHLDAADMTLERFSGYTAVLLGDIHKRQIFESHGAPWSAYPGSLIQQNFGEDAEKGYLLWNLEIGKKNEVKFRQIKNPYTFVSLNVNEYNSAALPDLNQSRYRLFAKRSDAAKLESVVSQLKSSGVTDVTVRYEDDVLITQDLVNVSDAMSAAELCDAAADLGYDLGNRKDAIAVLEEALRDALSKLPERKKWSLRAIRFDNILAYGADNFVAFDELAGIVGLFAPNNAGKSSFIGAMSYVLFNESDRNRVKNSMIINKQSDHCFARAVIDVDGCTYAVERMSCKTQKKDGSDATQTHLNVFKITDAELVDTCGEQRSDTEKILRNLIGDPDDCKASSFATQGNLTRFIDDGPTPRRAALAKALGLAHFEDVYKILSDRLASSNAQLRAVSSVDYNTEIPAVEQKLAEVTDIIDRFETQRAELYEKRRIYEEKRAVYDAQVHMISRSRALQEKIATLSAQLEIKQHRDASEIAIDLDAATQFLEDKAELAKHDLKITHLSSELASKRRSLQVLNSVPCGGSYATCQFIKDAVTASKQIPDCETNLSKLIQTKPSVSQYSGAPIQELRKELRLAEEAASRLALRETTLLHIADAKKELERLQDITIDNPDVLRELDKIKSDLITLDRNLVTHKKMTETLTARLERLRQDKITYDDLTNKTRYASALASAFSKKGVPLSILKSRLEIVNSRVKSLLESAVDITARAYVDGDDLQIEVQNGNTRVPIELACGAEKFFVALAFRMAMAKLSASSADFFIIDEGFGSLDADGLEGACKLLSAAKTMFSFIIVVSHIDYVKDIADYILEITTDETGRSAIKTKQTTA